MVQHRCQSNIVSTTDTPTGNDIHLQIISISLCSLRFAFALLIYLRRMRLIECIDAARNPTAPPTATE